MAQRRDRGLGLRELCIANGAGLCMLSNEIVQSGSTGYTSYAFNPYRTGDSHSTSDAIIERKIMGDKSPKSVKKLANQKDAKAKEDTRKKRAAVDAKRKDLPKK